MIRAIAIPVAMCCTVAAFAKPAIEMEVLAEPGLNTASLAQPWTKSLNDLGVRSVRFRGPNPGEKFGVTKTGQGEAAVYQVTVKMDARGALLTPGGQFSLTDGAKLAKWLDSVASGGLGNLGQTKSIFGLNPKQFEEVQAALAVRVGIATKGVPPQKVIEQLRGRLKIPLAVDATAEQALAADDPVRDELQELSMGTALAALARPAGAMLVPLVNAGNVELRMVAAKEGAEAWPIGWVPEGKKDRDMLPALFEFLNVEIDDVPAAEAITAIQSRLKAPFLFDHNNLVRHRIDLTKPVKLPAGKTYYRRIIDRLLFQVGLKAEIHLDEAGQPLVWITTVKK